MDGVISDKEREVIFRKSKELGVPEDECEIILNGKIFEKGSLTVNNDEKNSREIFNDLKKKNNFLDIKIIKNSLNSKKAIIEQIKTIKSKFKEEKQLFIDNRTKIITSLRNQKITGLKFNSKIQLYDKEYRGYDSTNFVFFKGGRIKEKLYANILFQHSKKFENLKPIYGDVVKICRIDYAPQLFGVVYVLFHNDIFKRCSLVSGYSKTYHDERLKLEFEFNLETISEVDKAKIPKFDTIMTEVCSSWTEINQDDIIDMNLWEPGIPFRDRHPQNKGYKRERGDEYFFRENRDLLLKEIRFLNSLNSISKAHKYEI